MMIRVQQFCIGLLLVVVASGKRFESKVSDIRDLDMEMGLKNLGSPPNVGTIQDLSIGTQVVFGWVCPPGTNIQPAFLLQLQQGTHH